MDDLTITRTARAVVIGGGLIVLLGLVAVATQSGFGHTGRHAQASHALISYGLTVFLILFFASIPVAIYFRIQQVDPEMAARRGIGRYFRGLIGVGSAFAFAYLLHRLWPHLHERHAPAHISKPAHAGQGLGHSLPRKRSSPTFEWPVLWGAIAVLVIAAVSGVIRARLRPPEPLRGLPLEEDVAAEIEGAIDDLEREPDARRAVIAAYARMEAVLGRHGLARRLSETPIEYLQRVLLGLTAQAGAVTRLTGLFERARFSTHEIDLTAKNDAITALREIREDMA